MKSKHFYVARQVFKVTGTEAATPAEDRQPRDKGSAALFSIKEKSNSGNNS